ncbi:hypothetical protein P7C73_g6509, partial [Tremellales sp. Uapishka_1]
PPPPPENPTEVTFLKRDLQIYQADIKVTVSPGFGRELERATKKSPPSRMPASLVFSRGEEDDVDAGGVFGGLCPSLDGERSAKVFIGQATGQTTGIGGHLAARFIPTVERESIDLVDRHVSHWNKELLWIGGYLSRMIYELEMEELRNTWKSTSVTDQATRAKLLSRGLHAMRFFSFKPTTPSPVVGQDMESSFYACAIDNTSFPLVSTAGILPVKVVRLPDPEFQKFLPELAVIMQSTLDQTSRMTNRLRERSLLKGVTFDDVIQQMGTRPLTEREMVDALKWWQSVAMMDGYGPNIRARLLDAAVLIEDDGKVVPLSIIQTFVKPQSSSIPPDMPLPLHTLPYSITKDLKGGTIFQIFGWTELSLLQYVQFLITPPMSGSPKSDLETDIRTSPAFAEKVLAMLGRAWLSIGANQQTAIAIELKDVACVPTKLGFKKPGEAYFEKNLLFDDLPTIALPKNTAIKGGMEKMLLGIGVRKTVDLQLVFSRLIGGGEWTCLDLMRYLVSVKDTLSTEELARLKQTAAFPLQVDAPEDGPKPAVIRQKPPQLYEPVQAMRELGLPMLDWGDAKWRSNSEEGRFPCAKVVGILKKLAAAKLLFMLGLKRYPPIEVLLGIAAGRPPMNAKALPYLLSNMAIHYPNFDPSAFATIAFLPAVTPSGVSVLAKPGEVFTNPACAILGFNVADQSVRSGEVAVQLRIQTDPPVDKLVNALLTPPTTDIDKARKIFEYMTSRLGHAPSSSISRLQNAAFIPVKSAAGVKLFKPSEIYFASRDAERQIWQSAFTFVDFGDRANNFLRYCGVKAEPSVKVGMTTDIAGLLITQPQRMLDQAGSPEKYLESLRLVAANWSNFDNSMRSQMKGAAFVLASQRVPIKKTGKRLLGLGPTDHEDEHEREWVLCKAKDAAVVDNITLMQYFGRHVLAAPEEHLLESFYASLGSLSLSSMVKTDYIPTGNFPSLSDQAQALRRHVLERLTIFLAETRRKQSDYSVDWLAKEGNFNVMEVRELKVRYTLKTAGRSDVPHLETLYATATAGRNKLITLTISLTATPDEYDIAAALCPLLMKSAKVEDALLLYSILSTPLLALKKRGFNVDRILNQQREEKLRIRAEAMRDREKQASIGEAPSVPARPEESIRSSDAQSIISDITTTEKSRTPSVKSRTKPSIMDKIRNSKGFSNLLSGENGVGTPQPPGAYHGASPSGAQTQAHGHGQGQSTKRPTDMNDIRSTVQQAIAASKPETGTRITDSQQASNNVSESQNSYCDPTGVDADLAIAFSPPGGVKIWLPSDVAKTPQEFYSDKAEICQRFISEIVVPVARVFNLPPSVMNVYWDREGPLIAFNRGGSLFCNARYYGAWHDRQVQNDNRNDAFISWYFTLAHELAHNLESGHNSSHEFYFSSIAEEYLVRFTKLLKGDLDLIEL